MTDSPSTGRIVPIGQGQDPWAREAFLVLREVAAQYGATITTADLAEEVQRLSGMRTRSPHRSWLPAVLSIVVRACHLQQLPPLTSLVVNSSDGRVGAAYSEVLTVAGLPPVGGADEREMHAAVARLQCYQEFGEVPEGALPSVPSARSRAARSMSRRAVGASGELTPKTDGSAPAPARSKTRAAGSTPPRKAVPVDEQRPICPTCFMEIPMSGQCPTCA